MQAPKGAWNYEFNLEFYELRHDGGNLLWYTIRTSTDCSALSDQLLCLYHVRSTNQSPGNWLAAPSIPRPSILTQPDLQIFGFLLNWRCGSCVEC